MPHRTEEEFDMVNRLLKRGQDLITACKKIGISKEEYLQVARRENTPEEKRMIEEFLQRRAETQG